jgi:hypothetical protein
MHKLFSLHKRPTTKKNKQVYYCQFYDESGNRKKYHFRTVCERLVGLGPLPVRSGENLTGKKALETVC